MHRRHLLWPMLAACVVDDPQPGTQIGVEEGGHCDEVDVQPIGADEVPEGAERSLADTLPAVTGRFEGTAEGAPFSLTVTASTEDALWVERQPDDPRADPSTCPPLWRVPAQAILLTSTLSWEGDGQLELDGLQAFLNATDGDTELSGIAYDDVWTVQLMRILGAQDGSTELLFDGTATASD